MSAPGVTPEMVQIANEVRNGMMWPLGKLNENWDNFAALFEGGPGLPLRHAPDHNLSFVSAVGNHSKRVAYGNNRADFGFIAGGIVPGVLILRPDYPENMDD